MALAFPSAVWSEREVGDYEACVAASYAMGLVHGGITKDKMPAPYTQAERERLEKVKDAPQDLATTDAMSLQVYGVQLRKLSTGSIVDAVRRINVGLCLTGNGSPGIQWQPGFTGMHAVFYVPTSQNSGYLGDPLAPNLRPFELIASQRIVAWTKGVGPNDAREVKLNEFAPPPPPVTYTQAQLDKAVADAENALTAKWLAWLTTHP